MEFQIHQREGIARAVARLEKRELARIEKLLGRGPGGKAPSGVAVHETRKALKRLRSRLLLIRNLAGEEKYREAWERYRDAGRHLAGMRDAQVKAETYAKLMGKEGKDDAAAIALRQDAGERAGIEMERVDRVRSILRELGRMVAARPRAEVSLDEARDVLRKLYRKGRKAARKLKPGSSGKAFHEWRKSAKHLYHLMHMLTPLQPKTMSRCVKKFDKLGELLGTGHDLDVLELSLKTMQDKGVPVEPKAKRRLGGERKRLRQRALALGRKLHAEKPGRWKPF